MMGGLQVAIEGGGARLIVFGDVDAETVTQLTDAFRSAAPDVAVDLSECSFMDSTGVAALVAAKSGASPGLRVTAMSAPVRLVLSVSGLVDLLCPDGAAEPSV